jgi:menaquinone-dependent protoporphyrinogen IX oxidase
MQQNIEAAASKKEKEAKKDHDRVIFERGIIMNKYRQAISNFANAYAN